MSVTLVERVDCLLNNMTGPNVNMPVATYGIWIGANTLLGWAASPAMFREVSALRRWGRRPIGWDASPPKTREP